MKPVQRLVCSLILSCLVYALPAQMTRIKRFSTDQGLPSDAITCMLQDRDGFIWIGTVDGLCRFDGYTFKVYKYDPDDPHSIPVNIVETLYEDRGGALWAGLGGGLARFDKKTERFTSSVYQPDDSTSLGPSAVNGIYDDPKGRLWVTTFNGWLQGMNRKNGSFQYYFPEPQSYFLNNYLYSSPIFPDPVCPDCFWIACMISGKWQLYLFNSTEKKFTPVASDSLPTLCYIWNVFYDNDDIAWFATSRGLFPFDPKTRTFPGPERFPEDFNTMRRKALACGAKSPSGQLWVGTANEGIYVLDKKRGIVGQYRHDPADPASLSEHWVRAILHDRSGAIWVGTLSKGLNRIVLAERQFLNFYLSASGQAPLSMNSANAFYESPRGEIWIGSDNTGLYLFDLPTRRLQRAGIRFPTLDSLKAIGLLAACSTPDGNLWFGANGRGLYRFEPRTGALQNFVTDPADSSSLSADFVKALLTDRAGRLWIGTFSGLDRYEPKSGNFKHYHATDPGDPGNRLSNQVLSLYEDRSGNIWVGLSTGPALFDPATGKFHHLLPAGKSKHKIMAIYRDPEGTLWAGAKDGLYRIEFPDPANPRRGIPKIRRYAEKDGLSHQSVLGIVNDSRGRLWISTARGLSVFRNPHHDDSAAPDFKTYQVADGLQSSAIDYAALFKSASGMLYVGGNKGFNVFHPDSIGDNRYIPPVRITALEKFDKNRSDAVAIAEPGVSARDEIVLSYINNIFSIEFAALDFREPANNQYAYRLLGFNDNWVQLGAQRQVTFTNLAPGTYTFEVRGTNSDRVWNQTPATLKIVITPPWWKTIWAYLAYAILFVAAVAAFIRARLRFLKNRTRQLEQAVARSTAKISEQKEKLEKQAGELLELDRLKSRFYANVTHELRTPLTLMLGPLNSVLKHWKGNPEHLNLLTIARENGQKLLGLISELLDLGKLDANRLNVEYSTVAIKPFLARLVAQFDSHAQYLDIRLDCHCELPPDRMVQIDAPKFSTVVNNLLSNALKFTPSGGTVEVELSEQAAGTLLLAVRDTGRGIHPDDQQHIFDRYFQTKRPDTPVEGGTGIGLALCHELTHLCGGNIRVESNPGQGSIFWVEWPAEAEAATAVGDQPKISKPEPLPAAFVQAPTLEPEPAALAAPRPGIEKQADSAGYKEDFPVRILVAEDNPDLQAYLKQLLEPEYDVIMARNGEEALQLLDAIPPLQEDNPGLQDINLIVSDIMMPRMDGFQLVERLKNDDRYRHIPVVMLTARTDMRDKLRALRSGVDDYLTKPFDEEELLTRVRNLVLRQNVRREAVAENKPEIRMSQADSAWLADLEAWTRANLHDEFLSVSAMAHHAALSERQLLRRMRELTGLSPQQYIGEMRLQTARETLERGAFRSVAEAAYSAGFGNAKAFTRAYRERFGKLPSSYY